MAAAHVGIDVHTTHTANDPSGTRARTVNLQNGIAQCYGTVRAHDRRAYNYLMRGR